MNVAIIGGTHPRHLYYHNAIAENYKVVGMLLESREHMIPQPPDGTSERDAALFRRHFANRDAKEREYFGKQTIPDLPVRFVDKDNLLMTDNAHWIMDLKPDLILIFGCHMLYGLFQEIAPAINLHLGLSPRYRGSATLFWPFYFLEPQFAGCTFHQIVDEPDAGPILHQCRPNLKRGDTIHDVSCRAVVKATSDMVELLGRWPSWEWKTQRNTGKCFLTTDFIPQHLRNIYEAYDDNLVDAYLDGELGNRQPYLYQDNLYV
jgi:folate-dependent phosphoribosylglycinamide formyltransferase PurN